MIACEYGDERPFYNLMLPDDDFPRLVPRLGENFFESFSVHAQTMADEKREFNR
jgi:hypothetical protein